MNTYINDSAELKSAILVSQGLIENWSLIYPFLVSFQKWFLSLIWGIEEGECKSGGERPELYLCI